MEIKEKTILPISDGLIHPNAGFDPRVIKRDFPILARKINGKQLVYLDNAATTQKPRSVISVLDDYYKNYNANVHRGIHTLAEEATDAMEATRQRIAQFIGGVKIEEIIFTRGTTESINLVAYSWGRHNIKRGDRIVLTEMEHHANLVPWMMLARDVGAELKYIPITDDGYLNLENLNETISSNTKLVALTQMSNVLGTINPLDDIIDLAHRKNALVLIDGAQSVPHIRVDVKAMDADFLAFSAHKMLGPTGIGVLYGRESILEEMEPFNYGGEMISEVSFDNAKWNELPFKFEAGTPNIAGAVGFFPALEYLDYLGMDNIYQHDKELTAYAFERLLEFNAIRIFGPKNIDHRGGLVSFVDDDIHPHDLATFLNSYAIATRAGHHCAQPLTRKLGVMATTRASFYVYNTKDDIDELIEALKGARRYFGHV